MNKFIAISGSRLYGCNSESSDLDIRGFFIPNYIHLLGRWDGETDSRSLVTKQFQEQAKDIDLWTIGHFFDLLIKGSATAIELLFVPDSKILEDCTAGRLIRNNSHLFITDRAITSFFGFAKSNFLNWTGTSKIKHLYHAVRIVFQISQLMANRRIDFNHLPHALLKKIKNGQSKDISKVENAFQFLYSRCQEQEKTNTFNPPDLQAINTLYCHCIREEMREYHERFGKIS